MTSFQGFDQWQQQQRRSRRRHHMLLICLAVLLAVVGPALTYQYTRPLPRLTPQTYAASVAAQDIPIAWPAQGQAAISWNDLPTPLTHGEQKPSPTASVAKLILALAILQKEPLAPGQTGPTIVMTAQDEALYLDYLARDGSVVPVANGQQMTEYAALQAIMLPSANNIADTLANWAYGSLANYRSAAQQLVTGLGMTHTTIGSDASGMSPDTLSTTADLVLLARAAIDKPVLRAIMSQKTADLPTVGQVHNYNTLLGSEVFGIKTGNTDEAGGCFVFAAEHLFADGQKRTFVGAVMALPTRQQALDATPPLLASIYQGFGLATIAHKDQILADYRLPWGSTVSAVASDDLTIFGWRGAPLTAQLNLQPLHTPQKAGASLGQLTAQQKQITVALAKPAPAPSLLWRLRRN